MSKKCKYECNCKNCCYVSKKTTKEEKREIIEIIKGVCSDIKKKYNKGASFQMVGSAKKI